ncbi:AAA family ATPase [Okibacterium fritillariae]|uniref:AAA domain-containing protein n=1 Tax=Okibacterium fritillariae TaxID=123320 RepID=A0A1T5JGQ2_9MICO|nr:AAA family ATPase [Okibacterium fritillariae]SKC50392.1 AAA domain-containing protein [Okibacterium fritillariae]
MTQHEERRPGGAASKESIGWPADESSLENTTRRSWTGTDIRDVVAGLAAGTLATPQPSVGRLYDGSCLLYAGRTNGLAGESGCGKTWTALRIAQTELGDGANVVYVDFEDTSVGVVARLLAMGVPASVIADPRRFVYVQPDERFVGVAAAEFMTLIAAMQPSLVVIDSTGESMAVEGSDPNSDDQVARWFQLLPTAIARMGPAVLLLDHLPKADTTAPSPIGSQRKRAAISGVQLIQSVKKGMSFARGQAGEAELVCTKDRAGHFVTGGKAATLVVNPNSSMPDGSGCDVTLANPSTNTWAPTKHMADISEYLETCTAPASTNKVCDAVRGKKETLGSALKFLEASGYVKADARQQGIDRVHLH